ncbi:zinc knuckle CX2CX4HX4C containing protein [Tanacetum coccineum]
METLVTRSKRIVKPTKIFDNSVNNTSRNMNKQKTKSKKSSEIDDSINVTVTCDGKTETSSSKEDMGFNVCNGLVDDNEGDLVNTDAKLEEMVQNSVEGREEVVREVNENEKVNEEGGKGKEHEELRTDNDSNNKTQEIEEGELEKNNNRKSFVDGSGKDEVMIETKLIDVPTEIDSNGIEIIVFDDVMIAEGSKKWEKTLCAYFVGYSMAVSELKFNLRKMWGRYGFKDIVDYSNGVYYIKFGDEKGLDTVVNNGPWMVKSKPLIVQKWDISMCLDKSEPVTIPLWVKICSVPLEAWTTKGISALASRIGKPLAMDAVSASMCKMGFGRVGFARVLVEVSAKKPLPYEIEIAYRNVDNREICRKKVKVVYDWRPPCCSHCCVFGHSALQCPKTKVEVRADDKRDSNGDKVQNNKNGNVDKDGFIPVQKKKNNIQEKVLRHNFKLNSQQSRVGVQKGNVSGRNEAQYVFQPKKKVNSENVVKEKVVKSDNLKSQGAQETPEQTPVKKAWTVHGEILSAMKRSANKYTLFELYDKSKIEDLQVLKNREIVDRFINQKENPRENVMKKWNADMIAYYKRSMEGNSTGHKEI